MKKWITTYIFFVGIILFSLTGNASSGCQNTSVKKNIALVSKKTAQFFKTDAGHDQTGNPNDEIRSSVYNSHPAGHSATSSFLTGDHCSPALCTTSVSVNVVSSTMLQNSYLLHLYPSHYFW